MRKKSMEELGRMDAAAFKASTKNSIVVVLDNVRSLFNVGSVFRIADAFRCEKIILCGITGKPPHRELQKTALGATETVTWQYAEDTLSAVIQLKADGYRVLAIEQTDNSIPLQQLLVKPDDKVALVFGHEVEGVSQTVLEHCEMAIEIPQSGSKHSLNISVCAGITVWEIYHKTCLKD